MTDRIYKATNRRAVFVVVSFS